jgi:hypothetical protein
MDTHPSDAEKIRDALTGTNWRDLATAPWVTVQHLLLLLAALHHVRSFKERALLKVSHALTRAAFDALPPPDGRDGESTGRELVARYLDVVALWLNTPDSSAVEPPNSRLVFRWVVAWSHISDNATTPFAHVATAAVYLETIRAVTMAHLCAEHTRNAVEVVREVLGEERTCALLREHLVPLLVSHIAACEDAARAALRRMNSPRTYHGSYPQAFERIERDGGTPR